MDEKRSFFKKNTGLPEMQMSAQWPAEKHLCGDKMSCMQMTSRLDVP